MAEKKHVIEYIDIIKSFEKVKEKLKNKSDKGHQHGNADITDIDASKIKSGTIDIDRVCERRCSTICSYYQYCAEW